jgi:hypothetical protein
MHLYGLSILVGGAPSITGVSAIAVSPTQINVSWSAVDGATSYRVERSPDGVGSWTTAGTTAGTDYADQGLTPATTYWYRVIAIGTSESDPSVVVFATTFEEIDEPNPGQGGGVYFVPAYGAALVRRTPQESGPPILEEVTMLAADGLNWSSELNREGQASVTVAPQSIEAPGKQLLLEVCSDDFDTPGMELWIHRGNSLVFAGPIVAVQPTATSGDQKVVLHARGLVYYLRGMWVKYANITGTLDQADVVAALIDQWQDEEYGNFGLDTSSIVSAGVNRQVNYRTDQQHNVLERISQLSARVNGFDFWIEPGTREVMVEASRGVDRTGSVVFDRRNIESAQDHVSLTAGDLASEAFGINGTNPVLVAEESDVPLRESWGRWGVAATFSSTVTQGGLNNQTARLLADVSSPMLVPASTSLIPVQGASATDFDPGDLVEYTFDHGFGEISVTRRVLAKRISVSEDGHESIGVELA